MEMGPSDFKAIRKGLLSLKWVPQVLKTIISLCYSCPFDDSNDFANTLEMLLDNLENKCVQVYMHISLVLHR